VIQVVPAGTVHKQQQPPSSAVNPADEDPLTRNSVGKLVVATVAFVEYFNDLKFDMIILLFVSYDH
jgi:hypothetical protein